MTKKLRSVLSVAYVILLVVAVCYAAWMKMVNRGLSGTVSFYQSQLVLSTNDCKQIVTDLESGNPSRLAIWKLYFDRAAEGKVVSGRPTMTFRELLGVYNGQYMAMEKPARSNYFGVLLSALAQKPESEVIGKNELLGYLGKPDETTNSPDGEVMVYKFSANGRDAVGLVGTQHDTVSIIDIQLRSSIGQNN